MVSACFCKGSGAVLWRGASCVALSKPQPSRLVIRAAGKRPQARSRPRVCRVCSFFFLIFSVFLCLLGYFQGFLVAGRDWSGRNGDWSILAEPEVSESSFFKIIPYSFCQCTLWIVNFDRGHQFSYSVLECVISVAVQYILCLRQVSALNSLK